MMKIANSVPEILAGCAVDFVLAIEAHRLHPCRNTLYVVILARRPKVSDAQRQLDYLVALPDKAWEDVPGWEEHREETLACIRRSIAWRTNCV
jgi:hypothetical protein